MRYFSKLFTAIKRLASLTVRKSPPLTVRGGASGLDIATRLGVSHPVAEWKIVGTLRYAEMRLLLSDEEQEDFSKYDDEKYRWLKFSDGVGAFYQRVLAHDLVALYL